MKWVTILVLAFLIGFTIWFDGLEKPMPKGYTKSKLQCVEFKRRLHLLNPYPRTPMILDKIQECQIKGEW